MMRSTDILPMYALHILLGRAWLFDRRVIHDGFRNTYVFQKDGKRIVLNPMSPAEAQRQISKASKNNTLFVGRKELEEAI